MHSGISALDCFASLAMTKSISQRQLIAEIKSAHGVGDETIESLQELRRQFDKLLAPFAQADKLHLLRVLQQFADVGPRYAEAAAQLRIGHFEQPGAAYEPG